MASCPLPLHSDTDPSVSICQTTTGHILLYCWGCDSKAPAIMQALNLPVKELFGDPGQPDAVIQSSSNQVGQEIPESELQKLDQYLSGTHDKLYLAEKYILDRFNLTLDDGAILRLGVDPGDGSISRPTGYEQFKGEIPHLIIPLRDPSGKPVGMQGRRLTEGTPRWRSKGGNGWSQLGCFGWNLAGPVILTEGPSDALAVVGHAHLPALAIRGASLTSDSVAQQIITWLDGREALVVGDRGTAGETFASEISEKVGIPQWSLPGNYDDLAEFLGAGEVLHINKAASVESTPTLTPSEIDESLKLRIQADLPNAIYDTELLGDLNALPQGRQENVFTSITAEAPRGQVTDTRSRVAALRRTVRDLPPGPRGPGGNAPHAPLQPGNPDPHLPEIIWNPEDQLHVTEDTIRDAMNHYEEDSFYRAARGQYLKVMDEDLQNMKEPGVKSMLSQMGHWRVIQGQRELGHVPTEAAKMVQDPSFDCDMKTIERRVEVPFMLGDGDIVSEAGFHEDSGIYLLPRVSDPIIVPPVPSIVTDAHVREAKKILEEVIEGFVFKDYASQTNLVAMTLTSPLRQLFKKNPMVPLLTSTAPQSGSGKGTSIRVPLSTAGVGPYSLGTTAYNSDDNEFEKKLVGKLLKKSTYIFLDNIRGQVNSAVLEQMLTAANYDGRTLGYSEVNSLSTLVLWVSTLQSTGSFNRDLTRRCVPVELIKNYKGKWAHKNIDEYLSDMRGPLIWACFVAARKWLQDGGQISEVRLDGYGGWTEVIGGILENVLGYEGFLDNLSSFRKSQDEIAMTIEGFLERWLEMFGEEEHPSRVGVEDWEDPALHQLLGLRNPPSTRQVESALTRQLDSQRGHIIGSTHHWMPLGMKPYKHEGMRRLFRCVPLPTED